MKNLYRCFFAVLRCFRLGKIFYGAPSEIFCNSTCREDAAGLSAGKKQADYLAAKAHLRELLYCQIFISDKNFLATEILAACSENFHYLCFFKF